MIKGDNVKKSYLLTLLINILSKPLGFLSSALMAYYFGTGQEVDAYLWIMYFIMLFYGITIASFESAIVAILVEIKLKDGIEKEKEYISFIFTWATILVILGGMLIYFQADFFVEKLTNFDEKGKDIACNILEIMCVYYIFTSLYCISESVLNSYREFKIPYFLRIILSPVIIILFIYGFAREYGINSIVYGNIVSFVVIFISLFYFLIQKRLLSKGITLLLDKIYLKSFVKIVFPLFTTQIINNLVEIFSKYLLTGSQVGSVAFVSYSERLISLVNSAFAENLSKIYFTEYGHVLHTKGKEALIRMYEKNIYIMWIIVVPISSFLFFFGDYVIALLFRRGSFDETSVVNTFSALQLLSLGLFAWSGHLFTGKMFAVLKDTIVGMYLIVPNSIIIICMYYYAFQYIGFKGVALASSLSAIYSFWILLIVFHYRHQKLPLFKIMVVLCIILIFWFGFAYGLAQVFKYEHLLGMDEILMQLLSILLIYMLLFSTIFLLFKNNIRILDDK